MLAAARLGPSLARVWAGGREGGTIVHLADALAEQDEEAPQRRLAIALGDEVLAERLAGLGQLDGADGVAVLVADRVVGGLEDKLEVHPVRDARAEAPLGQRRRGEADGRGADGALHLGRVAHGDDLAVDDALGDEDPVVEAQADGDVEPARHGVQPVGAWADEAAHHRVRQEELDVHPCLQREREWWTRGSSGDAWRVVGRCVAEVCEMRAAVAAAEGRVRACGARLGEELPAGVGAAARVAEQRQRRRVVKDLLQPLALLLEGAEEGVVRADPPPRAVVVERDGHVEALLRLGLVHLVVAGQLPHAQVAVEEKVLEPVVLGVRQP